MDGKFKTNTCRLCQEALSHERVKFEHIAVHNSLLDKNGLEMPVWREDISLYTCKCCGLVQQADVIPPDKLYPDAANYVGDWRFQPHLADQLKLINAVSKLGSCVELGCGKGGFLKELQRNGFKKTYGIEANKSAVEFAQKDGLTVFQGLFNKDLCQNIVRKHGTFDFFVARHVLEHIPNFTDFFECVDILLNSKGKMLIEVPDFTPSHTPLPWSFTFINHEHCTYFTQKTLASTFKAHGYLAEVVQKEKRGGGVLNGIASRQHSSNTPCFERDDEFPLDKVILDNFVGAIVRQISSAKQAGKEIVFYGAGSHGISFLNISRIYNKIDYIIDDVNAKHGLYIPGCRAPILPLSSLAETHANKLILVALHPEWEEADSWS